MFQHWRAVGAAVLASALFIGCGGGSVTTTPIRTTLPAGSGSVTGTTAAAGGVIALPAVSGVTGVVAVPQAIGAGGPIGASVTLSTTVPAGVPAAPFGTTLMYVTYVPSQPIFVPYFPQVYANFPAGVVPPGYHVVYLYYRLPDPSNPASHVRARARRTTGRWMTREELLAQSAPGAFAGGWGSAGGVSGAGVASGGAAGAGAAGISAGALAGIAAGVVAAGAIAADVASSQNNGLQISIANGNFTVPAGGKTTTTIQVQNAPSGGVSYVADIQDCANSDGTPSSAPLADIDVPSGTITSSQNITVSGLSAGTCNLAVTIADMTTKATVVIGQGAPVLPQPTPAPSPAPTASATPTAAPTATATPSPAATSTPTAAPSSVPSGSSTATLTSGEGVLSIPGAAGYHGSVSYHITGTAGQTVVLTSAAVPFGPLTAPAIGTGLFYLTISPSGSGSVTTSAVFDPASSETLTLIGSGIVSGQTYTVTYSFNGAATSTQTVTATSTAGQGEIDAVTPLNDNILPIDNIIGVVVSH